MTTDKKEIGSRKQITFDLSQKALQQHYPRPKATINPQFYKKAYADISRFMKENGFAHRQFSVYISNKRLTNTDVNILMRNLATRMPWLTLCVNQIDVTTIGVQHSLLQTLEAATALQTTQPTPKQQRTSMRERMAAAQAEAERRNSTRATDQPQPGRKHDLEK